MTSFMEEACNIVVEHIDLCRKRDQAGEPSGFHSRFFSHILHPEEHFVFVGKSTAEHKDSSHPEHLVPCVMMYWEVRRLLDENMPKPKIAKLLEKHWKIARISKEEARYIDSKNGLGLKTKMPDGWTFETGDTMARLTLAGIELAQSTERA